MWFLVLLLAIIPDIASEALYDLTGYISAPFDLCIFPGLFFYFKYKEPIELKNNRKTSKLENCFFLLC